MNKAVEICQAILYAMDSDAYTVDYQCELPIGHEGAHKVFVTLPQREVYDREKDEYFMAPQQKLVMSWEGEPEGFRWIKNA